METKHTKAPWGWQKFGNQTCLTAQHGMREIIISANRTGNLLMNKDGILYPIDDSHPNAKIITAAPEMFEALVCVRTFLQKSGINYDNAELYNLVDKAIKKATE